MPSTQAASIPAFIAPEIAGASRPLITISSTEFTPSARSLLVIARSVGQNASLVDAIIVLERREPPLLPLRTTPPGNGRNTPGRPAIASTAASAPARAAGALRARIRKFPPPTALI